MQKNHLKQLILSAFFLALGIVLPFLTMQIKAETFTSVCTKGRLPT